MNESVTEQTELPQPEPGYALGDLLGVAVPDLGKGEGLPPLWHWVYLLDRAPQADLGPDGHPVRGTLPAPPGPGPRPAGVGGGGRGPDQRAAALRRAGDEADPRSRGHGKAGPQRPP